MLTHERFRTRWILSALSILVVAGFLVTLERYPTFWPDSQLYASIARARQVNGTGIPSMLRHSPLATDHIRFYGPVFFDLAAEVFRFFGVSKWTFRLVSLFGALLYALAGGLLARTLSGSRDRPFWAVALLLLSPEIFLHAHSGSMDTVAVGLEVAALAIFVRGATRGGSVSDGVLSGAVLALAVATTPRTYPFACAFASAAILFAALTERQRSMAAQVAATVGATATLVLLWILATHRDGVTGWFQYATFIAAHEDTDVAILPMVHRNWAFAASSLVSPLAAGIGALVAARAMGTPHEEAASRRSATVFALVTTWATFVATACLMNMTLTVATYFALPLLAVVVALPEQYLRLNCRRPDRRALAAAAALLLCSDLAISIVRYVRIAATWEARDASPVVAFIDKHVPDGSDVIGPSGQYFFATVSSGAHYFSTDTNSPADWARWIPVIDPAAVGPMPRVRRPTSRFLIWTSGDDLPPAYACAEPHRVGTYTPPPPNAPSRLGWLARSDDVGYTALSLYALPGGCPADYDPTGTAGRSSRGTLR